MDKEFREKLRRCRHKLNGLANEVRQARLAAGIEQIALAQAAQRPRLWLTKRENGHVRMRIHEHKMLLAAIAELKRSQKPGQENNAKVAVLQKLDN